MQDLDFEEENNQNNVGRLEEEALQRRQKIHELRNKRKLVDSDIGDADENKVKQQQQLPK